MPRDAEPPEGAGGVSSPAVLLPAEADPSIRWLLPPRQCVEASGDSGRAMRLPCNGRRSDLSAGGDPALAAAGRPVGGELFDGMVEVVADGVDVGALSGAAEGDVGELAAAAVGDDMGGVNGGALGAVHGGGVPVVQAVRRIGRHEAALGGAQQHGA